VITAVDTGILSDIFRRDPLHYEPSAQAVRAALSQGALVACELVWAEIAAGFDDPGVAERALSRLTVGFSPIDRKASLVAGMAWREYRRSGGPRTRVVADFMIGAHALTTADRLLTRDRGFFRSYFGDLEIAEPAGSS
jgi:predicted nucleic acid-binding protein